MAPLMKKSSCCLHIFSKDIHAFFSKAMKNNILHTLTKAEEEQDIDTALAFLQS